MTRARAKRWARALGVLALFVLAFWLTGCDPAVFWARRAHLRDIAAQLFPPDWSYLSAIVAPLLATLRMSVTGTALGVALALGFAPLCAHNLPCPAPLRAVLRFLVQVLRSFPALILALLATFLFGLGTFSGTVAITVFTLAVMTRLTYEDIETLTLAPYRALCAMGASPARAYARAVVPEIASGYLTNALYLLETNVRHSAILGYVGAGGIGVKLNASMTPYNVDDMDAIYAIATELGTPVQMASYMFPPVRRDEHATGSNDRFTFQEAAACSVRWDRLRFSDEMFCQRAEAMRAGIRAPESEVCDGTPGEKMACRAGRSSFWINWRGVMTPCGMMVQPDVSVPELGFARAWEETKAATARILLPPACTQCEYKHMCHACAAMCVTETGAFDGRPEYVCAMTKATAELTQSAYERMKKT